MQFTRRYIIPPVLGFLGGILGGLLLLKMGLIATPESLLQSPDLLDQHTDKPLSQREQFIAETDLTSVVVQTFSVGRLERSGGGIIVSSDGLIITTQDVVPVGVHVYQVLYNDRIFRARVQSRDSGANLVLLKIDATDLPVAPLNEAAAFVRGEPLVIVGKLGYLGKPVSYVQEALVSYSVGKQIVIDTTLNSFLSGSALVDEQGNVAGITYLRNGKVLAISTADLAHFLDSALRSR